MSKTYFDTHEGHDVLALKDSDIGVAMGAGSSAARAVAQIVLLDNKFATLPYVVGEGRRRASAQPGQGVVHRSGVGVLGREAVVDMHHAHPRSVGDLGADLP